MPASSSKTTPIKPKDFWREISSENFKSAQNQKEKTNFPKSARNLMANFARNFLGTKISQFQLRLDRKKPSKL
jgi:hypothetical protein